MVGCFAVAAIAAFAAVDRGRVGSPLATLVSDGPTSNTRYVVTRAPAGSRLRSGDRVEIDDPRELAAFQYHSFAAGSTLAVKRISPLPEATIDEPVVANAQSLRFAFIIVSIEFLFIGVAGVVAARGRSSGSLQLAWLLTLIVLLINPTTPAWPTWLILGFALGGGGIAVVALLCACDFASRFAGDPDVAWARRYRAISLAIGAVVFAIQMSIEFGSFFTPSIPVWIQDVDFGALVAQAIVLLVGLLLAFVKAPEAERQRALWVVTALGVGIVGFVGAVLAGFAGATEPLRDIPLLLLLAMPLGCAYAILRYQRTTSTVARAARLQCSLFLVTADGYSRVASTGDVDDRDDVDRNDSTVVRLLATRLPVDLHDVQTTMAGDVAFPMFARNRLLGILSCGGKTDGVTVYAPDELEAIGAVAQAAGLALDLLRIEALERELEALGRTAALFTSSTKSSLSEAPS